MPSQKLSHHDDASSIITSLAELNGQDLKNDRKARKDALDHARRLVIALQEPVNAAVEMTFSPTIPLVARTAIDLNLYGLIERNEPITTQELSIQSGGQAQLISRLLRLLASVGFVAEVGKDEWAATPITKAMATPPIAAGHRYCWDMMIAGGVTMPQFLKENNWASPTSPAHGIFQHGHQTQYKMFEYLMKVRPDRFQDFNLFMGHAFGSRSSWVDWYPVEERLLTGFDPRTALLVDVGGGKGHDLQAFKRRYPNVDGRLVLQDLANVIDDIKPGDLDDGIERQVQDFFTPNATVGARTYFIHHCMHNCSDEFSLKILSHLRNAMTPGYSKLLIDDLILPEQGASTFQTVYDISMMSLVSGQERTRSQWTALLDQAGFRVVDFHLSEEGDDADGIVEAVLKE